MPKLCNKTENLQIPPPTPPPQTHCTQISKKRSE